MTREELRIEYLNDPNPRSLTFEMWLVIEINKLIEDNDRLRKAIQEFVDDAKQEV